MRVTGELSFRDPSGHVLDVGGRVLVYCRAGRHRSVAMGAAILIAQGHTPETAMRLIKQQRPISDPDIFYIRGRIFQFYRKWPSLVS